MQWSLLSAKGTVPDPSGYHSASVIGDKIIFFGGSDSQSCFSEMVVLDTSRWFLFHEGAMSLFSYFHDSLLR